MRKEVKVMRFFCFRKRYRSGREALRQAPALSRADMLQEEIGI